MSSSRKVQVSDVGSEKLFTPTAPKGAPANEIPEPNKTCSSAKVSGLQRSQEQSVSQTVPFSPPVPSPTPASAPTGSPAPAATATVTTAPLPLPPAAARARLPSPPPLSAKKKKEQHQQQQQQQQQQQLL
ncbi:hypothetical protein CRUP_011823, partial [Coryphaenoides rupestris]